MRKRIVLNDQGLYVDCIIENGRISFEFEKGLETLNNKVSLSNDGDIVYGLLGLKRFIRITKEKISRVMSISSTEIRILCALSNRVDDLMNSKKEKSSILREFYKLKRVIYSLPKNWNDKQIHNTELHTHFSEILNAEEFINFINRYDVTYPINDKGEIDFKSKRSVSYEELVSLGLKDKLVDMLRLDIRKSSSFDELVNVVNYARKEFLQRIVKYNAKDVMHDRETSEYLELSDSISELSYQMSDEAIGHIGLSKREKGALRSKINNELSPLVTRRNHIVSNILYDDLLRVSLDKLTRENIKYSEISFSNEKRLAYLSEEHKNDNRFKFLYSIDREKDVDKFRESSSILERLLNTDNVIGVDIMGLEKALIGEERESFKKKLYWLIPVLHMHPNSVLRVHASEFKESSDNMYETLKIIDEISKDLNDACSDLFGSEWGVIPPPRIRIGHGVNIVKRNDLVRLIKKYDAVIEINASSNYALGHIKSISDIPLDYYRENNIKYVISTDGGGVYSTSIHQEENLLSKENEGGYSKKVESEQINTTGSGKSTIGDVKKFKGLTPHIEKVAQKKQYGSFVEALIDEQEALGVVFNKGQVNVEIDNLSRYIMDNDVELDSDYFRTMIDKIKELNKNDKSDVSKIFLYLLESELFKERETPFKTLYYLDNIKSEDLIQSPIERSWYRLFKVVKQEYMLIKEEIIEDYNNDFGLRKGKN